MTRLWWSGRSIGAAFGTRPGTLKKLRIDEDRPDSLIFFLGEIWQPFFKPWPDMAYDFYYKIREISPFQHRVMTMAPGNVRHLRSRLDDSVHVVGCGGMGPKVGLSQGGDHQSMRKA